MPTFAWILDRPSWPAAAGDIVLKVAFLFAVAWLAAVLLGRSSAAVRHRVWCLAFCGALLAPLLAAIVPEWRLPILPPARQNVLSGEKSVLAVPAGKEPASSQGEAISEDVLAPQPIGEMPLAANSQTAGNAATTAQPESAMANAGRATRLARLLAAAWAAGCALSALPLLTSPFRKRRLLSVARPPGNAMCQALSGECRARLGLRRSVRLFELDQEVVPMAWGVLRPLILLPASCAAWSEQRFRAVLLHELAHVKRLDLPLQVLARAACAVYWFNPLVWYGLRRLGIERERACDDCVVQAGERASDYAAELVQIAEVHRGLRLTATVAMARTSRLEDRVRCLFDRKRSHLPLTRAWAAGLSLAAGLVVLLTAAAHLLPREAAGDETARDAAAADETAPAGKGDVVAESPDPAQVRQKIAALAAPDETAPVDERAVNWLSQRRDQILPQLIAALDDKNSEVAQQCLEILRNAAPSNELTAALIAKAGDARSPLRYRALRQLETSAADPRVSRLLDQASTESESFPDPLVRARWAWLAGHPERATRILEPAVRQIQDASYESLETIRLLGEIAEPSSARLLMPIAAGDRWGLAAEAYKALAKIDPANHGLTEDQAALLNEWRVFKESREHFRQRMDELSRLNVKEVRPFVLQMLRDKDHAAQEAALSILAVWKDAEALPRIRDLLHDTRSNHRQQAVEAFLAIDDGQQAQDEILDLLKNGDEFANEAVVRGIAAAAIPVDRKLNMLRAAGQRTKTPNAVPQALRFLMHQDSDIYELLAPLMDGESDLPTMAGYCEVAALHKERQFAAQIRRAMQLLSSEPTVSAGGDNTGPDAAWAAQTILSAVSAYELQDLSPEVRKLMRSRNAAIRTAAQAAGARLGVAGAMNDLYAQLGATDAAVRAQAALALSAIRAANDSDRAAREDAILSNLGKPSEDYALRVLVTCGGEKSVKALERLLDQPDAQRAVHAAWVLAQLPGQAKIGEGADAATVANKGVRRLAICGLFHHQMYQQGSGIDFQIAPGLAFHQTMSRLNPDPKAYAEGEGPVRIPDKLLELFDWDDAEQQFAIRCYQLAEIGGSAYDVDVEFLQRVKTSGAPAFNRTHLPLLKEIAAQDSHVVRLLVRGQAVAHFEYRQLAAQAIAAITEEAAAYVGLAGERLDSKAYPGPYRDQDQLLAKFLVDRIQKCRLPSNPQKDAEWRRIETFKVNALQLKENFGERVLNAVRQEAERRKVGTKNILP